MTDSKRIAVVGTEYRKNSHVDVIVSRWLAPLEGDGEWGWPRPRTRIASMYLDQFPENDLGRDRSVKFDLPLYETVAEALCLGGDNLEVDGVLLIGEHGDYPFNDRGQHLYPRKELFDRIVEVFRKSGRTVPVFCDKFLSWNFDWACQMQKTADDMGFMLCSGSSIPLCQRRPPLDLSGATITDAVATFFGDDEAYGYHSLEYAQALVEKRAGGERGIVAITAWRDEQVAVQQAEGAWDFQLAELGVEICGAYQGTAPDPDYPPLAFRVEYADGLCVTHVKQQHRVENWALAVRLDGEQQPRATAAVMGEEEGFFQHFATLCGFIEESFLTDKPSHDSRRNLLTTGATAAMMRARATPGVRLETPELAIEY